MLVSQKSYKNNKKNICSFFIIGTIIFVAFLTIVPLRLESAHAAEVTLAWDSAGEGQNIDGYTLSYGTESGIYTTDIDVGNTTTCIVPDLEPGDTYYFTVAAYNSYGTSGYSNEVSYTPPFPSSETFVITTSAGVHGGISPSGSIVVDYGSRHSLTIVPDEGYRVENVLVDGESKGSVLSWTFDDIVADHVIAASFVRYSLPPNADPGPDQTVGERTRVVLNASNSTDPDDGIKSYLWGQTAGIPVVLSDPWAIQPTFDSPDVGSEGAALIFQLIVTDRGGLQSQDSCIVNVPWENEPPVADAGGEQEVYEGAVVALDGSGSFDNDDGIASYQWTQTGGTPVVLSDPRVVKPTFRAPAVDGSVLTLAFQLVVTDNGGMKSQNTCTVTVVEGTDGTGQEVIELNKGWNLVSLNRQPENTDITAIMDTVQGKYKSIQLFREGSWKISNPDNPTFSTLTTMETGYGYWINMKEPGTLIVTVIDGSTTRSIELVSGWNMVSYNGEEALPADAALASIEGRVISAWEFENNEWKVYYKRNPAFNSLTIMRPGYGYWINVTEACTWILP